MTSLHQIRLASNAYIRDFDTQVELSLDKVEQKITNLNRKQLLSSKDNKDRPLMNNQTGKTTLSPAYAKRTGKKRPNLKLKGTFQFDMFTDFRMPNKYFQQSSDFKQKFLTKMYDGVFGVSPKNQSQAKEITTKVIVADYRRVVWLKI